ncbi:hypothetical protein [Streptomyces sp. NPDC058045]|uniref:hypothetical protein n=1 Tax=Streptomyces sp. NPDC058045 TaxID=3346311 RepID=UPI0036EC15D1
MEPREFWDRNTVLAEAFCVCDERVRQAQAVLDEAMAERSRTLAAFAVTVGDDGTIAHLMGLPEREVRVARRTVGRTDARAVAEQLLTPAQPPAPEAAPAEPAPPEPAKDPAPPAPAAPPAPEPAPAAPPEAPTTEVRLPHPREEAPPERHPAESTPVWSSSMDSVLLWSWKSGLDLQTVAAELGLDIRALLLRVQALADDGILRTDTPTMAQPQRGARPGRHRGRHEDSYTAFLSPNTTTFPAYA